MEIGLDFWDADDIEEGPLQNTSGVPRDPTLRGYQEALCERFPGGWKIFQEADHPQGMQASIILGSHSIDVGPKKEDPSIWVGDWQQSIGSLPIGVGSKAEGHPLAFPIAKVVSLEKRECKSLQDFKIWLQLIAYEISAIAVKQVYTALEPDNFMPDPRMACMAALNLSLVRAPRSMILSRSLSFPWKFKDGSAKVTLYHKGGIRGGLGISFNPEVGVGVGTETWSCGGIFCVPNMPDVRFKRNLPEEVVDIEQAKALAGPYYILQGLKWLTEVATKRGPKSLGASW